jgi:hypothetical protein
VVLALAALAHAGPDVYGFGEGRDGVFVAAAPATVVNSYRTLAADALAGTDVVELDSAAGITDRTLVMITATGDPTLGVAPSSGTTLDLTASNVGRYELARVLSVVGDDIHLDSLLLSDFAAAGSQVITVPEYETMTVDTPRVIVAPPWDGERGGIVAFLVADVLALTGTVSADSAGFRGGVGVLDPLSPTGCGGLLSWPAPEGGMRGEGVSLGWDPASTGQGNLANGGGGGVCQNGGGAGGGNGGAGGRGGGELGTQGDAGGYGGAALTHPRPG